ncbi:uncharacterized protein LOC127094844 [Lathyrus oleraceus]|uniref:uncharacterized protein LOC127094844 n=1 Tax=Pisum sativum TaxID=3888 RepID=UPI0021CE4C14|nr:uncharacterized protein LOC127094844 [Pisum sativum]
MPPSEAPVEDADTLVLDTSILDTVPAPAVGASPSTGISPAASSGKANQDAVSPASPQADASTEPSQPVVDYTPASPISSLARPFQSVDTAGESIEFPLQISDSDSDSVTSPVMHPDSSSTSSDSSLSSASLQDPRGPVGVNTNKQQSSQTTPLSTASPPQITSPSAASPSTFPGLTIKPFALEAITRLHNLVKSRDASSDSEQLHSGKMGPEATKAKALMDKVRVYALNSDLPFVLMHEPIVGPEILSVLAQLKGLHISNYAKRAMAALEQILVPMLRHIDNVRDIERQIVVTEAFVKEKWELVTHADAEVTNMLGAMGERRKELTSKQTRAIELRQQIDALWRQIATLDSELESIVKEESRFVDEVLKPAQPTVEQTTSDALAVGEELMAVEGKLEELKAHADTLEFASLHYNFELKSFQSKFGQL